jgi:flavin reductase (DIM6/NTAB) family NADH-FMN oxidoreductase RutF
MKKNLEPGNYLQGGPPSPVVLATCVDSEGNPNIITLAMFMYISRNPPQVCIGVAPPRYSHDLIIEQGEFTINVPSIDIREGMHRCGIISGRDVNKFEEVGFTPIPAQKIKSPIIQECYGHLECKVVQTHICGDHTLIIGEVIAGSIDPEVLDKTGQVISKSNPVIQKNWNYHTVKKP